jgi:N-acetylmuramoyl-L-alanine amidase
MIEYKKTDRSLTMLLMSLLVIIFSGCAKHDNVAAREIYKAPLVSKPVRNEIAMADPRPPFKLKPLIVIDPGHGGKDLGTHSNEIPKYYEKHFTLSTAHMLKRYLDDLGYNIVMTRSEDVFIPLKQRAHFANDKRSDIFISIHYNSAPSKQAEGIEVFYYTSEADKARTDASKLLATKVLNGVTSNTKAQSRGVKSGNFAVIRETKMPAILVEGGFLTNSGELEKIRQAKYMKRIALGIAEGVRDYLKAKEKR